MAYEPRFTFSLSADTEKRLTSLAEYLGLPTNGAVLSRAIGLLDLAYTLENRGSRLVEVDSEGIIHPIEIHSNSSRSNTDISDRF